MSCLAYRNNELWIENVSLKSIAESFGTPCYVYSRAKIESNWLSFNQAFMGRKHLICYAVKANDNIAILRILAKLGSGFDIVSLGELERVLAAGGDPHKIVFSGIGKREFEIEQALKKGVFCIDVESAPELERIQKIAAHLNIVAHIALRINPHVDPLTHSHISTGLKQNKFGIEFEEVIPLCIQIIKMPNLKLIGIACHIGSQITSLNPFMLVMERLLSIDNSLRAMNIELSYINVGGGLGITYRDETPPLIAEYAEVIKQKFTNHSATIILEPGRAIIANAGILLTKIEYIKLTQHKNFIITDAGMNDFIRVALYDAWQQILPVTERTGTKKLYDIVGPVCESADYLGKNRELNVESSDLLALDCAGAYGFSMSSNYNARPRPAEVLVDDNQAKLIRRRETIADLLSHEMIE